jgi:hypothetical protein
MQIHELFAKPVDRTIEGVIKADDEAHLATEIHEYIITNEVVKHLQEFFEAYISGSNSSGVWISGFFGSGKSHLLKILSLVLENRNVDGHFAGEVFSAKLKEHPFIKGNVDKAIKIPSRSILFNIDQKADVISKREVDAILSVFLKVFNEMQGFYPKQPYIAQFERDMVKSGRFESFKQAFGKEAGEPWETGRETAHGIDADSFAKAYCAVTGTPEEEGLKVLDRYRENYTVSIEDFANLVAEYLDTQDPKFRLNFFVDEVGQFIADNSKLMVNLQTISESLSTKCKGRAWILVTSQEDMSTVVGEMARVHTSTDFSKIQDRFKTRLPLTSKDVSEVIQKRLLAKKDDPGVTSGLNGLYNREQANFRTLFGFSTDSRRYGTFTDEESFADSYPFIPYQYDLFQAAINGLSRNNAFVGKHASVGERSMLGVFQEVAKRITDKPFGTLATFDLMFEGIRAVVKTEHQQAILTAERNLGNPLAVRILKCLFLVKFLKEFKGSTRNISILVIDAFDIDLQAHEKDVQEALNVLERQTYVQRTGEAYEFLTDDEKDIENEIKATDVDSNASTALASSIVYDEIIKDSKIRHDDNQQDYPFAKYFDGQLHGRDHELSIQVVSPFHELHDKEDILASQSMGKNELLVVLPHDKRLFDDLALAVKTDKFLRLNNRSSISDSKQLIFQEKGRQNANRKAEVRARLQQMLTAAKFLLNGSPLTIPGEDPQARVRAAFQHLIRFAYPNLKMLKVQFSEDSAKKILEDRGDDLFIHDDNTLSEAEGDILTHIRRRQGAGERPTVGSLLQEFSKRPYGWYQSAILANTAKLFVRGKIELRADSNNLNKADAAEYLGNSRQFNNTIVSLQEEFPPEAVQKLKKFHQAFFDETNPGIEAKAVATQFLEKLKSFIAGLDALVSRHGHLPFTSKLSAPLARLKEWSAKEYKVFLKDLGQFKEDWLDDKEDYFDPIQKFLNGPQLQVYKEVQEFFRDNHSNLSEVSPQEADQLQSLLQHEAPYEGRVVQDAKALKDRLAQLSKETLETIRQEALDQVANTAKNLETLDGFDTLDDTKKQQLLQPSERTKQDIRQATLIAVVRDKKTQYLNQGYQAQINTLNQLLKGPDDLPTFVPRSSIPVNFPKAVIENQGDLETYLQALRSAFGTELSNNKKITL